MTLLSAIERERVKREQFGLELELLIREARRRQRRRRLTRALAGAVLLLIVAGASVVAGAGRSDPAARGSPRSLSAGAAARCPASSARLVANSVFTATVLGTGPVRLGIGNLYERRRRKLVVVRPGPSSWGGIEAIWIVEPGTRGPISVRGLALGKQGPIDVQPSGTSSTTPGAASLTLPAPWPIYPAAPYPANSDIPGALFVRAGGCYALEIRGRSFSERLVFDVQTVRAV